MRRCFSIETPAPSLLRSPAFATSSNSESRSGYQNRRSRQNVGPAPGTAPR